MKTAEEWELIINHKIAECLENTHYSAKEEVVEIIEEIRQEAFNAAIEKAAEVAIDSQEKSLGKFYTNNQHSAIVARIKALKL